MHQRRAFNRRLAQVSIMLLNIHGLTAIPISGTFDGSVLSRATRCTKRSQVFANKPLGAIHSDQCSNQQHNTVNIGVQRHRPEMNFIIRPQALLVKFANMRQTAYTCWSD